jgi:hypothetical protein
MRGSVPWIQLKTQIIYSDQQANSLKKIFRYKQCHITQTFKNRERTGEVCFRII